AGKVGLDNVQGACHARNLRALPQRFMIARDRAEGWPRTLRCHHSVHVAHRIAPALSLVNAGLWGRPLQAPGFHRGSLTHVPPSRRVCSKFDTGSVTRGAAGAGDTHTIVAISYTFKYRLNLVLDDTRRVLPRSS